MSEFRMPSLGADMESGILVDWHVKPGDAAMSSLSSKPKKGSSK